MQQTNHDKSKSAGVNYIGVGIAVGAGIGVALGTATGATVWTAPLCIWLGILVGSLLNKRAERQS